MDVKEYLKQQLKLGVKVPDSINLFKNGLVDTSRINTKQVRIFDGLLWKGQLSVVVQDKLNNKNKLPVRFFCSLINRTSPFTKHFNNCLTTGCDCTVITNNFNINNLHRAMTEKGIDTYSLVKAEYLYSSPEDFYSLLQETRPKVVEFVIELTKSKLPTINNFLIICQRENIAVLLFSLGDVSNFDDDSFNSQQIVTVKEKKSSYFIESYSTLTKQSVKLQVTPDSSSQESWESTQLTDGEFAKEFKEPTRQIKPAVDSSASDYFNTGEEK